MIGKDDSNEEVTFKVADRRKFNSDGTLKEGVTLEEPEAETTAATGAAVETRTKATATDAETATVGAATADDEDFDEEDLPGAENPASFVNFLSTLVTNAAASLGAVPHPATGQRTVDLETGKYWLDVLGMLQEKTAGNLHPKESRLLEGILGDLRMQYVQLMRATEEKLKAQAAQKFTGADILGKK
jgi:hypothetical protein